MKKVTLIVLVLILLSVLVGCAAPIAPETVTDYKDLGNSISRFVDTEAGVVCWISRVYLGYSISCLPLISTKLPPK